MKKIWRYIRHYYLFYIALLASAVALPLQLWVSATASNWVLAVACGIVLLPLLWRMWQDLGDGKYGVDILAATAIITSIVLHEYWAAMVIVLMLTGGEALENYAERRADKELDALLQHAPHIAHVKRGNKEVDVKASAVQAGDTIVIKPGEIVPADAVIIEGSSSVDESSLTGESLPINKTNGDELLSGAVVSDGLLIAKASRAASESQYARIIKLVRGARASQAPFVRLADRYAVPFTLLSFAIAGAVWAISGDAIRFLEVIVVATPCPLILAAPIAIISGMSRSAKHGIIVKTGTSLERLAQAKTFAFDKTGTLTKGELKVDTIKTFPGFTQNTLLTASASLEQHSNHALARAISVNAQAAKIALVKTKDIRELAGKGVVGTVSGKEVVVGTLKLMEERDVALPKPFNAKDFTERSTAFVAINGTLAGAISFSDELRSDATTTLERLRKLGITNFMMVTGDSSRVANAVAKKLSITKVIAGALPGEKLLAIEAAQRPVAFVGDGVNDAPVLTASDVGVALGAKGSAAATESADVVIMHDELARVAQATSIARRTFMIAKQSIVIGIALSIVLMLVFATGKFKPIYGAVIQELVDVVVIFNALRAHSAGKHAR
ncbi:MAG TPA: heavy metal translocating P-type ATPase [Candidatus Saccharimonadales bacterium]|nr:heavy metal translocating P-type ATPase [Candidatus Saccharimonadales bacterium]